MQSNKPWYVSSTGDGLSASVGGFSIVGIAQTISLIASMFGHPVNQDSVVAGLTTIITAVGACIAAFGIIRKIYFWVMGLTKKQPPSIESV